MHTLLGEHIAEFHLFYSCFFFLKAENGKSIYHGLDVTMGNA